MQGRLIGVLLFLPLTGCAAMQQQQAATIVQEAKTQLQTIMQTCMQRIDADREIDPIRNKVELARSGIAGAPPPNMLSDRSRPTAQEKAAIAKWESVRESCAQQQMQYGLSLSLPASLQPVRNRLVLVGRETNQRTGLLVSALYEGRLTYGQFAAERMKTSDQMMASLMGGSSPPSGDLPNISPTASTDADEIPLHSKGGGYLVPVAVNGLPSMDFLLDTGSSSVALPAEVVFTLWRTGSLRSSDFIGNQVFVLADGRKLPSLTFKIRELKVGQHVIRDVVGSLSPALTEPLLGGSFLSRFASWRIDNQRSALVLSR